MLAIYRAYLNVGVWGSNNTPTTIFDLVGENVTPSSGIQTDHPALCIPIYGQSVNKHT
jgi:hypothetical protein